MIRPFVKIHTVNVLGRASMAVRANAGRRALVPSHELRRPTSVLTTAAKQEATRRLTPALLEHSYRTYLFGAAIGHLEQVAVDREPLFAAAMLHDTGLRPPAPGADFNLASAAVALHVAEAVGLSTAATRVMRNAITLHRSPDVSLGTDGPVAYLLSAGAALDVIGLRSWTLPPRLLDQIVADHPRLAFKREFASAVAAEAAAVPWGRWTSCAATARSTSPSGSPRSGTDHEGTRPLDRGDRAGFPASSEHSTSQEARPS